MAVAQKSAPPRPARQKTHTHKPSNDHHLSNICPASSSIRYPFSQAIHSMDRQTTLRILSLDGGGIRGISSLYILKDLMAQIEEQRATIQPPPTARLRPCDVFDLICGTSTGGLIAIMLGRLQMVHVPVLWLRPLTPFRQSNKLLRRTKNSLRLFFPGFLKHPLPSLITLN